MGTTVNYSFPYPSDGTPKNTKKEFQALAVAMDTALDTVEGSIGEGGGGGSSNYTVVTASPYNADNTGTNDARGDIQDAIDDVAADGGGVVFLPAGSYKIVPSSNAGYTGLFGGLQLKSSVILKGEGFATLLFGSGTWTTEAGIVGIGNISTTKAVRQAQVRDVWIKGSAGTGHATEITNCDGILFNTAEISDEPDAVHRITNVWVWDCDRGIVLYGVDDQGCIVNTVRGRWFRQQGVLLGHPDGSGGGPDNFLIGVDISSANRAGAGCAGFEIYSGNTHLIGCKSWYVKRSEAYAPGGQYKSGAGFYFGATRIMGANIEAQDNGGHGVVFRYGVSSIVGLTADSNSYYDTVSGSATTNECSGVMIGSGVSALSISGLSSFSRSPSHQDQKHGIVIDSAARGILVTGAAKDNAVVNNTPELADQVAWTTTPHATHLVAIGTTADGASTTVTNGFGASGGSSGEVLAWKAGLVDEVLITGTTLTDDVDLEASFPGGALRYKIEGFVNYRADATTDAKMALKTTITSGSGTCEGFAQWNYTDAAGTQARLTRYMNSTGSNQVICEGAGQDSSTATVRSAYFVGAVYAGSSVTTGKVNVALAESSGTGNGVKIITGSWLKLTPLA